MARKVLMTGAKPRTRKSVISTEFTRQAITRHTCPRCGAPKGTACHKVPKDWLGRYEAHSERIFCLSERRIDRCVRYELDKFEKEFDHSHAEPWIV